MFTGIVQSMGTVKTWKGKTLWLKGPFAKAKAGDSVAVEGCCLTVTRRSTMEAAFDLSEETLKKTSLGRLKAGEKVNLEPALKAGDALGGHFVSGHVEGVGRVAGKQSLTGSTVYAFDGYKGLGALLVPKGSVTVDGVSLTIVAVEGDRFTVAVIPHTEHHTTLGLKKTGAAVNIEPDLLIKYLQKLVNK